MIHPALHREVLEDHAKDRLRSGEGSAIELKNGNLLLLYTHFDGGGDASPALIARRTSCDGGQSWTKREPLFEQSGEALNCMSASLARLSDGTIGCLYATKWSTSHCTPTWSVSEDEGLTWSRPRPVTDANGYFVVNNDRLAILADGTIAVPYALHPPFEHDDVTNGFNPAWNAECGLFYSRDNGRTWNRSAHSIKHTPDVFRPPLFCDRDKLDETARYIQENRLGVFQEPGLVQLSDGRLMMYMRSLHGIYRCFAQSVEAPWLGCDVFTGFHVCCGPQTIKQMPGSARLLMLYNDRGAVPMGVREFHFRTPLSVAISDDDGATWQRWGQLEDGPTTYCYFSLLFFRDQFLITCYEGAQTKKPDGRIAWRPLASLKLCAGSQTLFA